MFGLFYNFSEWYHKREFKVSDFILESDFLLQRTNYFLRKKFFIRYILANRNLKRMYEKIVQRF